MAEPAAGTVAAPAATGAAANADPKTPPVAVEATEDYVVNGKTVKLTKAQAKAYTQKGLFADGKLKSMNVLSEKTAALLENIKTPAGLLKILKDPALGASPKAVLRELLNSDTIDDELKEDLSKWVYENVVKKGQMTPEQIENDKKLTDYERLKKEDADRKKATETQQNQAQVNQVYQAVRAEISKQIVADKTFPQTEGAIRSVVDKLRVMNKKGAQITTENISKALALVKKDHILHQQTMFDAIEDPESLIALVGEARALKISKALVARLKAKGAAKAAADKSEPIVGEKARVSKFGMDRHGYTVMDV